MYDNDSTQENGLSVSAPGVWSLHDDLSDFCSFFFFFPLFLNCIVKTQNEQTNEHPYLCHTTIPNLGIRLETPWRLSFIKVPTSLFLELCRRRRRRRSSSRRTAAGRQRWGGANVISGGRWAWQSTTGHKGGCPRRSGRQQDDQQKHGHEGTTNTHHK
jgi:hypothetical protein